MAKRTRTTTSSQVKSDKTGFGHFLKRTRHFASHALATALAIAAAPSFAQVLTDGVTSTIVETPGAGLVTNVTNPTLRGSVGYNTFSRFDVNAAQTVNVVQPNGTTALVNIIRSSTASSIDGILNARLDTPTGAIGGNVFFVNAEGFMVSASGVINAGRLTLSAPTGTFVDSLAVEAGGAIGLDTASLFAGTEPLNGEGVIEMEGTINASRLDMRAGARLLITGRITVDAPDATGAIRPAVNAQGRPAAGGVVIGKNGVVRLVSPGDVTIERRPAALARPAISASRGDSGGLIEVVATGALRVDADFDVSATGLGDGGAVTMFAEGNAAFTGAISVDATAVSGNAGFFTLTSDGDITLGSGLADTAEAVIDGRTVTVDGDIATNGGSIALVGDTDVTIAADTTIDTRTTARDAAGDIVVISRNIDVVTGTSLLAQGTAADSSGLIALTARNITQGIAWAFVPENNAATVTIDGATILGGTVVVTATATATNTLGSDDDATESAQIDSLYDGIEAFSNPEAIFTQLLDTGIDMVEQGFERTLQTVNDTIPLPVRAQFLKADATVTITNSTVTADGKWSGRTDAPIATDLPSYTDPVTGLRVDGSTDGVFWSNSVGVGGFFSPIVDPMGLKVSTYEPIGDGAIGPELEPGTDVPIAIGLALLGEFGAPNANGAVGVRVKLPTVFDTQNESVLIGTHALTQYAIAPRGRGLGIALATTDTISITRLTNTDVTAARGDIRLLNTAYEDHLVALTSSTIPGAPKAANGIAVMIRDLQNQLVVQGGSITAQDGGLTVGAQTAKKHSFSVLTNAGREGVEALALNISTGNSLTEAAIGGTITLTSDLALKAETLYFDKTNTVAASMGLGNPDRTNRRSPFASAASNRSQRDRLRNANQSKTVDPSRAEHAGLAFAIGVEVDRDDTFARLGGSFVDLADPAGALLDLGLTVVATGAGAVSVVSNLRWADRLTEGGVSFNRSSSAAFDKVTNILAQQLVLINAQRAAASPPLPPLTQDDLLGRFDKAVMLSVGVGVMNGETVAEVGDNTTLTAATLGVTALTRYPNTNILSNIATAWGDFTTAVTEYEALPDGFDPTAPQLLLPKPPSIDEALVLADQLNPFILVTTMGKSSARAGTPSDGSRAGIAVEDQALAFGVTTEVLVLNNTTTAAVRSGASVTLTTEANISALQESLMFHVVNLPIKNPLGGDVNDSIGAGITVAVMTSRVTAEIEDGATVIVRDGLTRGDVNVNAEQNNIRAMLAFSGGQGEDIGLNASVSALVSEADTTARIGENARITAGDVNVSALDESVNWSIAGAVSASENVGFGGSGAINFTSRSVRAGIFGLDGAAYASTASDVVIDAATVRVTATNDTLDISGAVAGAKVNQGNPAAVDNSAGQQEQDDKIIPDWLFDDDETDALTAQNKVEDLPASEDGQKQSSGWAIAAAASLNLMLDNRTEAVLATQGQVKLTGDLDVTAATSQRGITVGGAVSMGLGAAQDTNALAGAFGVHVDTRILKAEIRDAAITTPGAVRVSASDNANVLNIAVGGAGTSRGDVALAGSVSVAVLDGETSATLSGGSVDAGSLTLRADDLSQTVNIAGAVAINMSKSGGAGVGVGIAVATISRSATAQLVNLPVVSTGGLSVTATSTQRIFGFGISAGVGKTGLAGSVVVNTISGGAFALVEGTATDRLTIAAQDVTVTARENNDVFALSGALAGGRTSAVGAAVAVNVISTQTRASLANTDLVARANRIVPTVADATTAEATIYAQITAAGGAVLQLADALADIAVAQADIATNQAVITGLTGAPIRDVPPAEITLATTELSDAQNNLTAQVDSLRGLGLSDTQIAENLQVQTLTAARDTAQIALASLTTEQANFDALEAAQTALTAADTLKTSAESARDAALAAGPLSAAELQLQADLIAARAVLADARAVAADPTFIIRPLGAVSLNATSSSTVFAIVVAGAATPQAEAVGAGIGVNVISGGVTADATLITAQQAKGFDLVATSLRTISAIGGGAAVGGTGAGGAALVVNVIANNDTVARLDGANITLRDAANMSARLISSDTIRSLAAAISASKGTSVAGGISVNVIDGNNALTANDSILTTDGNVTLGTVAGGKIESLSGGAALSVGGPAGVGLGVSANFIDRTNDLTFDRARLSSGGTGGISATATTTTGIDALAIGLAAATGAAPAVGGSVAIGDIGNRVRVTATGAELTTAGDAVKLLAATKTDDINIISGSLAVSGGASVGGAITVATIHGGTEARLVDLAASAGTGALEVTAVKEGTIDAIAISGAGGTNAGVAGSFVFAQIGQAGATAATSQELQGDTGTTTVADSEAEVASAKQDVMGQLNADLAQTVGTRTTLGPQTTTLTKDDVTVAEFSENMAGAAFGRISVTADDSAAIRSLAGGVAGGGTAGVGAGIGINLLFQQTLASMRVGGEMTITTTGTDPAVKVAATQTGSVETLAIAAAGGGTAAVSGSILVNVSDRSAEAILSGATQQTVLANRGANAITVLGAAQDVAVTTAQTGTFAAVSGAIAGGGKAAVGAAVIVNVMSDDAAARIRDVSVASIDAATRTVAVPGGTLLGGGTLTLTATQALTQMAAAISGSGSGIAAITGSFAVNVIDGDVVAEALRAQLRGADVRIAADATNDLTAFAGAAAISGAASVGLGVASNTTAQTVLAQVLSSSVRAWDVIEVTSRARTGLSGNAVSGAISGAVGVSGSAVGNTARNSVTTRIGAAGTADVSGVLARGTVLAQSRATNVISMLGGISDTPEEDTASPGLNITISGGGAVGVGGSVTVNLIENAVLTDVSGGSVVTGLGAGANVTTLAGTTARGTLVQATGGSSITMAAGNGSVGGTAGVSALVVVNKMTDTARVTLGGGTRANSGAVGSAFEPEDEDIIGNAGVTAAQDTILTARIENTVESYAVALGAGGAAGVGAANGTNLLDSSSEILVSTGQISAARNVFVRATTTTTLESWVVGLGGGFVGGAGSLGISMMEGDALITLRMAEIQAEGDATIATTVNNTVTSYVGAGAGGVGALAASVNVTSLKGRSAILVERATALAAPTEIDTITGGLFEDRDTLIEAGGTARLNAQTITDVDTGSAAGSIGGGTIAIGANVTLNNAVTSVVLGADQRVRGAIASVTADETITVDALGGALAIGAGFGAGAGLDFVRLQGATTVALGDRAQIITRTGVLRLAATSTRTVNSTVGMGSAGSVAGIAAAVGIVEVGGTADVPTDRQDDVTRVRTDAQAGIDGPANEGDGTAAGASADEKRNTSDALAGYVGGAGTAKDVRAQRRTLSVIDAVGTDTVSVTTGADVQIISAEELRMTAQARNTIGQDGGAFGIGGFAGIASGTLIATVGTGARVQLGDGARLSSTNTAGRANITLGADIRGGGSDDTALAQRALTVAGGGVVASGVGVASANVSSNAALVLGSNVSIVRSGDTQLNALTLQAIRNERVATTSTNVAIGISGGVGTAVSLGRNTGLAQVTSASGTVLRGNTVNVVAADNGAVSSDAVGSAGGILAGGNGSVATATNTGTTQIALAGTMVRGTALNFDARSTAQAQADATGVSVAGGLAVGVSTATARNNAVVDVTLDGDVQGTNVTVSSRLQGSNTAQNARAFAASTSGGILSGNGAVANAWLGYAVTTTISGILSGSNTLDVATTAQTTVADAEATGKVFGGVAIGTTIARAGQASGQQARVDAAFSNATIGGARVTLGASNAPGIKTVASSGSGGVISGAGAEATQTANTVSRLTLDGATAITAGRLTMNAAQNIGSDSQINTLSAAAVGLSGGNANATMVLDTDLDIGGGVTVNADRLDVAVSSQVTRPETTLQRAGFNMVSGSGGLFDTAGMISQITVDANTDLTIGAGATLRQTAAREDAVLFRLGASSNMILIDRFKLDSGGAIAVPTGTSNVDVRTNRVAVNIGGGGAATLLTATGELQIYAGANADIRAEVDTKTYGLAGAGVANSRATLNADTRILVNEGSSLRSEGDIKLLAGYTSLGAQRIDIAAESRVFNKTAIPISSDPLADATADTLSNVTVAEGAEVIAVRDVTLFAEAGGREVLGYGRGKDLYREVAAAIASAVSEAFDGEDVSLDIESGSSVDQSDDLIIVDGLVRAGARNYQVLGLDANNLLDNSVVGTVRGRTYDNDAARDIDFTVTSNVSSSADLLARIAEVQSFLDNNTLNKNAAARASWNAEIEQLNLRLALEPNVKRTEIVVGPIIAVEGNIFLRADAVTGAATGILDAPGDAVVILALSSGATLRTNSITLPDEEGGRILFNDVSVSNADEIRRAGDLRAGTYAYDVISGENSGDPLVLLEVSNGGGIIVQGAISNFRGEVKGTSEGDIDIRADIDGNTVNFTTQGSFTQGFSWGFSEVDGAPEARYDDFFDTVENQFRATVPFLPSDVSFAIGGVTLPDVPRAGRIRAGKNVFITADWLNINGLIQAGQGSYNVLLKAGLEAELATLRRTYSAGTELIFDPLDTETDIVIKSDNIESDTKVFFNFDTNTIEIDPMIVQGGTVVLTGQIISTGSGEIRSLDGFGRVNLVNETSRDVLLSRVDLGAPGELAQGIEGLVRITDTSKPLGGDRFLTTEFTRIGNTVTQRNNTTFTTAVNEVTENTFEVPTFVVSTTTGRGDSYVPVQGRDYVIARGEESVARTDFIRKDLVVIGIRGSRRTTGTPEETKTTPLSAEELGSGPFVTTSLAGPAYDYQMRVTKVADTTTDRLEFEKTHDSVRWYKVGSGWQHFEWHTNRTTRQVWEHRLNASHNIRINFDGNETGGFNVQSKGTVIFGGAVSNLTGPSTIQSDKSILTGGTQIVFGGSDITLTAGTGRIGSVNGSFRVDQRETGILNATASTGIDIREMSGDMRIGSVATTERSADTNRRITGAVRLQAQGGIFAAPGAAAVQVTGSQVELVAETGGVGPLTIDTQDGDLIVLAQGDVDLTEVSGDLALRSVESQLGNVRLAVPTGALLDRNDIETRDIRSEAELTSLYADQLGLTGSEVEARRAELLEAVSSDGERRYAEYWQLRGTGTGTLVYTLDTATRDALVAGGRTLAEINDFVAAREIRYAEWNAQAAPIADFDYVPTAAETAEALATISWSTDELTRSLSAGFINDTQDTNSRVEDPNVTARGNIVLEVKTNVGELLAPYVISGGGRLTDEDLRVLSSAERADTTIVAGSITINRAEDLNFASTGTGNLRIIAGDENIFVASESGVAIDQIIGTKDVRVTVDGNIINAELNPVAITGSLLIIEAGNTGAIGTQAAPLTVNVLPGGNAILRGGSSVDVAAPLGELPLGAVSSQGVARLTARGAITDFVGSGQSRIRVGGLVLDGGTVGTRTTPLPVWIDSETGTVSLTTRTGDAFVDSGPDQTGGPTDLRFAGLTLAGGGAIRAGGLMELQAPATFGGTATLALTLAQGLDVAQAIADGTVLTGGTAIFASKGEVGTTTAALRASLSQLFFAGMTGQAHLRLFNNRDLVIGTLTQDTGEADTRVTVAGDLNAGTITVPGQATLTATTLSQGRVLADRLVVATTGAVGGISTLDMTVGQLDLTTTNGAANLILRDRNTTVERITLGGASDLALNATASDLTLAAGPGITSQGGAMDLDLRALDARANILSGGGIIDMDASGRVTQLAATRIDAGTGTIALDIAGDATLAGVITTAMGANALTVRVDGTLRTATGEMGTVLSANTAGAETTLTLNVADPVGPFGLRVALDVLDATTATGDLHLREDDVLILRTVDVATGALDVFADSDLTVRRVTAQNEATISTAGDLRGDGATIAATDLRLFAFGGDLRGVIGNTFTADTSTGSLVHLLADGDLRFTETAGPLRVAFALSETGDLALSAASGAMTLGLLGAGGTLELAANGDLTINRIGHARIDIADEVALQLIEPARYGIRLAKSPDLVRLTARGPGATLTGGLISVKQQLELRGEIVNVTLRDDTGVDGLDLIVTNETGGMTGRVQVDQVNGGIAPLLIDPFAAVTGLDRTAQYDGETRLNQTRIGTGEVTVQGEALIGGPDLIIGGDVWLRQRDFDVLAKRVYVALNLQADAELLKLDATGFKVELRSDIDLTVGDIFVLNRRLGGVGVNGGQGFAFLVATETAILGRSFRQGMGVNSTDRFGGILETGVVRLPIQIDEEEEPLEIRVPMITTASLSR